MEKEFKSLSDWIDKDINLLERNDDLLKVKKVKEFFKKILTPNNISKGFVEVSTIKHYAGDDLIW